MCTEADPHYLGPIFTLCKACTGNPKNFSQGAELKTYTRFPHIRLRGKKRAGFNPTYW